MVPNQKVDFLSFSVVFILFASSPNRKDDSTEKKIARIASAMIREIVFMLILFDMGIIV